MRNLFLFLGLALVLPVALKAVDLRPLISREAGKYAGAWQRSDYQAIVSYLPAHVIQQLGGRPALLLELKDKFAQARALGANELETFHGAPSAPRKMGRWLASVLPVTAIVHGAHLNLTQETHVLALSANQGKSWSFMLLYEVSQLELNGWFPEFRGQIVVPKPPAPRVKISWAQP